MKRHYQKHGMFYNPLYCIWKSMKQRCFNKNSQSFANYGGRGITVCDKWVHSFETFVQDMGPRPAGTTLDRINNDGNYEPENCRWITLKEQRNNTRQTIRLTLNGVTKTCIEWAAITGLKACTIRHRKMRRNWSDEQTLTMPLRNSHVRAFLAKIEGVKP